MLILLTQEIGMTLEEIGKRIAWMLFTSEPTVVYEDSWEYVYEPHPTTPTLTRRGVLGCYGYQEIENGITVPCLQAILDEFFSGVDAEELIEASDRLFLNGCDVAQHPVVGRNNWTHYICCDSEYHKYKHEIDEEEYDAINEGRYWLDHETNEYIEAPDMIDQVLHNAKLSLEAYKEAFNV